MDPFPCVNIVWPEVSAHAFCALTHTKVYRYPLTKISGGSISWVRLHLVKKGWIWWSLCRLLSESKCTGPAAFPGQSQHVRGWRSGWSWS